MDKRECFEDFYPSNAVPTALSVESPGSVNGGHRTMLHLKKLQYFSQGRRPFGNRCGEQDYKLACHTPMKGMKNKTSNDKKR